MSTTTTSNEECTSARTTIAVAQMCSTANKVQNLLDMAYCAGLACRKGAKIIFFPEACGFMGSNAAQTYENAEPAVPSCTTTSKNPAWLTNHLQETIESVRAEADGSDTTADDRPKNPPPNNDVESLSDTSLISLQEGLETIARSSGMWLSAGGVHVRAAADQQQQRVYNTHWIFDSTGKIQAEYRKIHLFDVSLPNVQLKESNSTAPGHHVVICDSPIGRLGLTTCYDVRFPELYVQLVKQGAEILLIPSAFTVPTGQAHWHILLRARAIESQCYVIASAQYGQHNEKRASYGHALVVDPWGTVLADAGGGGVDSDQKQPQQQQSTNPPSIVTAEVNLAQMNAIRQRMPVAQHRDAASYE